MRILKADLSVNLSSCHKPVRTVMLMALLVLSPVLGLAGTIAVSGQIVVSSDYGDSFKAGDTFNYSFSFDDQTIDSNSATHGAQFGSGVMAFALSRGDSNSGTWDPSVGVFMFDPEPNFSLNANGEGITLQLHGSGLPQINGADFLDIGLTYGWGGVRDFVDTGSGQTFAEIVGISPLDFSTASGFYAEIRDSNYEGPNLSMSVTAIPEPSTYATLVGLGALGVAFWRRRRRAPDAV